MIVLNGKTFAPVDSPAADAVGLYRKRGDGVALLNLAGELIGVVNLHGVLCCATKLADGRYWYNHATIPEIGQYSSYGQHVDECRAALKIGRAAA